MSDPHHAPDPDKHAGVARRRSPQEKKSLSLRKDRRNTYGENDKASRKAIPLAKARANRANRRIEKELLTGTAGRPDMQAAVQADDRVGGRRRKVWRKSPDQPLGEVLTRKGKRTD